MSARQPFRTVLTAAIAIVSTAAMAQDAPPPIDYDAPVYASLNSRPVIVLPTFDQPTVGQPTVAPAATPTIATDGATFAGPADGQWQGRWIGPDRYEWRRVGSAPAASAVAYAQAPPAYAPAQDEPDVPDFVQRCARLESGAGYGNGRAGDADLADRCREFRTGGARMAYGAPMYGRAGPGYPPYGYTMMPSYEPVYVERRVIETVETVPAS